MARKRLGDILLEKGIVDKAQLQSALEYQKRWGKRLGDCVVELGYTTEVVLVRTLSEALHVPMIDVTRIDSSKITREILDLVAIPVARRQRVVPLALKEVKKKKRLVLATSDPLNYGIFDELQFKTGCPIIIMVAPDSDIDWFIRKYYLSEMDALPENYVSGISVIEDSTSASGSRADQLALDPITNIFF
jgi:type IV pilus assembly protein PilB